MIKKTISMITMALVAVLLGCGDEEKGVGPPGENTPNPTINNIWPNNDGTSWTYQLTQRTWTADFPETTYSDVDSVPPFPPMDEIEALLASHPTGDSIETDEGVYRLKFDGMITTESGVTAQNLTEATYTRTWMVRPYPSQGSFYARLFAARPDLRERILASAPITSRIERGTEMPLALLAGELQVRPSPLPRELLNLMFEPVFLHGYAWRKTNAWIGQYGDVDTLLAWKFLEADLTLGHEFTHQLIPSLASDVFLHARVLRSFTLSTELGPFDKCLEVLYAVDYGISEASDIHGHTSYYRVFDYGTIVYAPTVGPVYSYERRFVEPGDAFTLGLGDVTLSIVGTNADN